MDPTLLRGQFALALFILLLALLILPFQDRGSGAFVVTVLAGMVGLMFIGVIALAARWSVPRLPSEKTRNEDDKPARTDYNGSQSPGATGKRLESPGEGEGH